MLTIRKATREDAVRAFDIRRTAILNQCKGHYPNDALELWANGKLSEQFICVVEERFYLAMQDAQVVGTGMIDTNTGAIDAVRAGPGNSDSRISDSLAEPTAA